jgi:DNA-binding CsgD family transcriptional regulator
MTTPIRASDRDLRALAAIVSQDREAPPAGDGLPPSLLTDRKAQIPCDYVALLGFDGVRQAPSGTTANSERHVRLDLRRSSGPDFSERDRAVLTLLRPHLHLHRAYLAAERHRHPVPRLTPRQNELLRLLAAGHTNSQIARQLGISEGTVRTHLENIYQKLGVSSRTAAVTRAFPDRAVQDPPGHGPVVPQAERRCLVTQ